MNNSVQKLEQIEKPILQKAIVSRASDLIPTSWLDPLLTGDRQVLGEPPYGCKDIERLLQAIKARIVEYEENRG